MKNELENLLYILKIPKKPKCKDCIHYWKRKEKKEICTKDKGIKTVSPCDYFED